LSPRTSVNVTNTRTPPSLLILKPSEIPISHKPTLDPQAAAAAAASEAPSEWRSQAFQSIHSFVAFSPLLLLCLTALVVSSNMYSRLITAADFAATKHQTQRRKDAAGTPYINHPIGVGTSRLRLAMSSDVAVPALIDDC